MKRQFRKAVSFMRVPRAAVVAIAIVVSPLLLNAQRSSASHTQPDTSKLRLVLRNSRPTVSLHENFDLEAALHNDGYEPVYLFSHIEWSGGGGMILTVEDDHGAAVTPQIINDALIPPPPPEEVNFLARVPMGHFFGVTFRGAVRNRISKPGRYRLRAIYSSILGRDEVNPALRNLNVLWQGHEPIVSAPITIEITP